jgi:hypothetical protein
MAYRDNDMSMSSNEGTYTNVRVNNIVGPVETIQTTKVTTSYGCGLYSNAGLYVLSGSSQPLLVALLKQAGIADPSCQLYMLFYYLFPSVFILPLFFNNNWPARTTILKTCVIAVWDILSQTLNYTGASLAGRKSPLCGHFG